MLITFTVLLVALIVKLDWVLSFLGTLFSLLSPLFIGISIAFMLYPMYLFFRKQFIRVGDFVKSKVDARKSRAAKKKSDKAESRHKSLFGQEVNEKFAEISAYRKEQAEKKKKDRPHREHIGATVAAVTVSYIILVSIAASSMLMLFPQLGTSVKLLADNMKTYMGNLETLFDNLANMFNIEETLYSSIEKLINTVIVNLSQIITGVIPKLFDFTKNLALVVSNIVIGLIMSIYMVLDKDVLVKKSANFFHAILPKKVYDYMAEAMTLTAKIFSGYISSRFLDSLLVGIICYIGMIILGFPYALLISVVVGITNIIPVFGPFMGAIPSAFILLMIDPMDAVWFSVFILVLQQVDGNVLGPKITGDSIGLPVIWTMMAILVGGGLFGIIGMLLGVPTFAVIYALIQRETGKKLEKLESQKKTE